MTRRTTHVLAAVTLALVLLLVALKVGERGEDLSPSGRLLLPEFEAVANDAYSVVIYSPNNEAGVAIQRKENKWVVNSHNDHPADISKLGRLIMQLAETQILEEKTSNAEHYGKLGVGDPADGGKGIKVTVEGEDFSYAVILGNKAQGSYRYARNAQDATSYLVDQNFDMPKDVAGWLAPDIVDIGSDQIKKVVISHSDGETITIEKADQEQTDFEVSVIPKGRELSYSTIANEITGALAKLELKDVRPLADARAATMVTYETWEGLKLTAQVSIDDEASWVVFSAEAAAEDTGVGAQVAEINDRVSGWQYRLTDYKKNLLTRRWADILKPSE
ncbi:MAG: DUF4340 domain-containing protein [Betaproteobacteria bacterium]|nr:MAG: DUF4340 domain-containing protein [Betaproteobacteria bacterium]